MAITLGLVEAVDSNGVYVSMPGSRGVLRGPYETAIQVVAGERVLLVETDDGQQVVAGALGAAGDVSVKAFGARGDSITDDSAAFQSALDAAAGASVTVPSGVYHLTDTVDIPADTSLKMCPGADLRPDNPEQTAFTLASGSSLQGGKITSAELWDGTNTSWTYAVVRVEGDGASVRDVSLVNVPRVGIGVDEADDVVISGCRIYGGYTTDLWNSDNTASVHFGIAYDPGVGDTRGNFQVTECLVKDCVQAMYIGNYGAGDWARGVVITGNVFEGCHNHGIYAEYTSGATITGNTFNRCCGSVVAGLASVVSGNTMITRDTGEDKDRPQISMRNPTGCVVSNNTIRGEGTDGSVVIDLSPLHGDTERSECRDNVVTGNTVDISSGTVRGIRVGSGEMTSCDDNVVRGNIVKVAGSESLGVITVGDPAQPGAGNDISGNTVVIRGASNGIQLFEQVGARLIGNEIRLEYDADDATNICLIALVDSTGTVIAGNRLVVTSAFGDNVSVYGVWENGSTAYSEIEPNPSSYDMTKLSAAQHLSLLSGTGVAQVHETGTGAPGFPAGVGSIYRRRDGGAATTLYVKESGTDSAGWVGK